MHILVIPSWYKSPAFPYMGSFFEEQARALMKAGNKVSIFYPNFYPLASFFKKKSLYEDNWNDNGLMSYIYTVQSIFPRSKRINNSYLLWRSNQVFKKYIQKQGIPDLIHAHSIFDAGLIGLYLSRKYHIPMVITEHLTHFTGSLKVDAYKMKLAAGIFRNASASIAVSKHFKGDLERELGLDSSVFKVIYNMMGEQFYKTFVPKTYQTGEPFLFFTNSFLNERKNHFLIFDSMKILIQKGYSVRLKVGGSGEMDTALKKYIADNGLSGYVTFLGGLTRERVKEELDECHAFLLSSKFESFGVVLIESLASGRPVVSTDSGGPAEIVEPSNGILVQSFEPAVFAAAMEKMICDYNTYNQEQIRNACYKRFSESTITCELMKLYQEVILRYPEQKGTKHKPIRLFENMAFWHSLLFFPE